MVKRKNLTDLFNQTYSNKLLLLMMMDMVIGLNNKIIHIMIYQKCFRINLILIYLMIHFKQ